MYRDSKEYLTLTAHTVAEAISLAGIQGYKAVVLIDALSAAQAARMGTLMRRMGVATKKVHGVRVEESNALIRLADAVCGLVRDGIGGKKDMTLLLLQATQRGQLIELNPGK